MTATTSIPKGSTVLVTGVNGFLGMHVADQLLLGGYKVRGTVRDFEKTEWTKEYFDKKYGEGNFDVAIVKDLAVEGAFDELIKGCSGICHVASDVTFGPDPNKVITPVLNGIASLLHSAALQPSIKSFVLTSSSAAVTNSRQNEEYTITRELWNEKAVEEAWAPPPYTPDRGGIVYSASKTQAEQKAWELVKDGSGFKFNSINPNFLLGKVLHPKQNKSTAGLVLGMLYGAPQAIAMLQTMGDQWAVDTVDVAKLHVIALTNPAVSGERILAYAEKMNFNMVVDRLGKLAGADAVKNLEKIEEGGKNLGKVDVARAEELLRGVGSPGLKSFDESVKELLDSVAA
ncbi:hypothetical protein IFR05_009013 [Cadophora sp. M221]|nr:hypothetical protein IFR05_009013 [Cadophora sp. M221]